MPDQTALDSLGAVDLEVLAAEIEMGLRVAHPSVTPGIAADQRARCRGYAQRALEAAVQSAARLSCSRQDLDHVMTRIKALQTAVGSRPSILNRERVPGPR